MDCFAFKRKRMDAVGEYILEICTLFCICQL